MNNYPTWWNETLTVYNKYIDPTTRQITWYRTVVNNCFWKYVGNEIVVGETTIKTDNTLCRIPKSDNFIEKHIWCELENKSEKFTLSTGDILVKGEVTDEIDEYTSGSRSSDLLTKYRKLQGCMMIEKCSINTDGGRGNEHYYVKGI